MRNPLWQRPKLPTKNSVEIGSIGWMLFAVGAALCFWALVDQYSDAWLLPLGAACSAIGINFMLIGLVIKEIRQLAFEAALRAGEVSEGEQKTLFPLARK